MSFKENLQTFRKANHLSQEKLAQKVGISRQSISKWETGEAYPEMVNILALCTVFHCKITELIDINSDDYNNFDKETKKEIVDLTKKDRKRLKGTTKIIYILARIARFVSLINFVLIGVVIWVLRYTIMSYLFSGSPKDATMGDINFANFFKFGAFPKALIVFLVISFFVISSIFVYKFLRETERFFKNIHDSKSPFSLENIICLKKIARNVIIWLISDAIAKLICSILIPAARLTFNPILAIFALAIIAFIYIFRYGYLLQSSKS